MTGLFHRALEGELLAIPPIWLMRQAGRYHSHYQRLRTRHTFEALCRTPELAADVVMGPIDDFDFDAAILFSDLLYPLDALGLRVTYAAGRPEVDGPVTFDTLARFRPTEEALTHLFFQRDAVCETRARLSSGKGLIGFIGGPWTLFAYAVEGGHTGPLATARQSLDLYRAFASRMVPLLVETARLQLQAGADIVMVFDTAAGALPPDVYRDEIAPDLRAIASAFPDRLGYYARDFSKAHAQAGGIADMPWAGVGLDMHRDLTAAMLEPQRSGFVHGNFDPHDLLLTGSALENALKRFIEPLRAISPAARRGWICGLGHGVLPGTPEESVRTFVGYVRETFS